MRGRGFAAVLLLLAPAAASAADLTVYSPQIVNGPLRKLADAWTVQTGNKVIFAGFNVGRVRAAVEKALAVGAVTRDAIAQFLFPREDWRLTVFSLDGHPHLRTVRIAPPNIQSYRELLGGAR